MDKGEEDILVVSDEETTAHDDTNYTKTKRLNSKRASKTQKNAMLDILLEEGNKILLQSNFKGTEVTHEKKQLLWKQVAFVLNDLDGCIKTADKWNDAFQDWRSKVKARMAAIEEQKGVTGGGRMAVKPLDEFEQKMANFIAEIAVKGVPQVPVAGLDTIAPKNLGNNLDMGIIPSFCEASTSKDGYTNQKNTEKDVSRLKELGEIERRKRAFSTSQASNKLIKTKKRTLSRCKTTRKESIEKLVRVVETNNLNKEKHREQRLIELKRSNDLKEESNLLKRESLELAKRNSSGNNN